MNYKLYICDNCESCERVVNFINDHNIKCEIINLDRQQDEQSDVVVFPALYDERSLLAYGEQILVKLTA